MDHTRAPLAIAAVSLVVALFASCGPSAPMTDPVAIIRALFDNINRGKAEAASGLFSENGELITAFGQPTGQTKIKAFFQITIIPMKIHVEIKEISLSNGTVIGTFLMQDKGELKIPTLMVVNATVQAGKIQSMTWSVSK